MRNSRNASELGFSHYDKVRLQKAMHTVRDKRTFLRLKAVWLFASGMKIIQIASIADKSRQIIYQWINAYLTTHQPDALKDGYRTKRPANAHASFQLHMKSTYPKCCFGFHCQFFTYSISKLKGNNHF